MSEPRPSENIFAADLPATVDDAFVLEVFGAYGEIRSFKALPGKAPGQKGAALIRYATSEQAASAVEALNGAMLEGMPDPVHVRFANPRQKGDGFAGKGTSQEGFAGKGTSQEGLAGKNATIAGILNGITQSSLNELVEVTARTRAQQAAAATLELAGRAAMPVTDPPPSENVFVNDLPGMIDENSIIQVFSAYGTIQSCKALPGKGDGQPGAALIRFATVEEAEWLVENLNGNVPEGLLDPIVVKFANPRRQSAASGGSAASAASTVRTRDQFDNGYGKAILGELAAPLRSSRHEPYGNKGAGCRGTGHGPEGPNARDAACDIESLLQGLFAADVVPGSQKTDELCLYIKGLPRDTTDLHLYKLFSPFGAIAQRGVKAMTGADGLCTGIGFVDFLDPFAMQTAMDSLHGTMMPDGTTLAVQVKAMKRNGAGKGRKI